MPTSPKTRVAAALPRRFAELLHEAGLALGIGVAVLTLALSGCAAPKTLSAPYSPEIASAAADVADRVEKAVSDRPDLQERPLFIQRPSDRPFFNAFHAKLLSELTSKGLQVSPQREDSITLAYGMYIVAAPGGGRETRDEAVLFVDMSSNNRRIIHVTYPYTFRRAEREAFAGPGPGPSGIPKGYAVKTVRVVND